jgi:hypothetical protein
MPANMIAVKKRRRHATSRNVVIELDMGQCAGRAPMVARVVMSALCQERTLHPSFDHLVGTPEQRRSLAPRGGAPMR